MTRRTLSTIALLLCASAAACGGATLADEPNPSATESAAAGVEDVNQYAGCLVHGVDVGGVVLGNLRSDRDPGTPVSFNVASCIVGRLTTFRGARRPYNLQSFKNTAPANQTFFFQRQFQNVIGEAPAECLKVKLSFTIGATDVYVKIERVKQLPAVTQGKLCSDNGET